MQHVPNGKLDFQMSLEGVFEDIFESFHIGCFFLPKNQKTQPFLIKGLGVYKREIVSFLQKFFIFSKG